MNCFVVIGVVGIKLYILIIQNRFHSKNCLFKSMIEKSLLHNYLPYY